MRPAAMNRSQDAERRPLADGTVEGWINFWRNRAVCYILTARHDCRPRLHCVSRPFPTLEQRGMDEAQEARKLAEHPLSTALFHPVIATFPKSRHSIRRCAPRGFCAAESGAGAGAGAHPGWR